MVNVITFTLPFTSLESVRIFLMFLRKVYFLLTKAVFTYKQDTAKTAILQNSYAT